MDEAVGDCLFQKALPNKERQSATYIDDRSTYGFAFADIDSLTIPNSSWLTHTY
jgi:hypothetical protein